MSGLHSPDVLLGPNVAEIKELFLQYCVNNLGYWMGKIVVIFRVLHRRNAWDFNSKFSGVLINDFFVHL